MAEALYRKYRPQVFEDVVGQEHIERTIKNAIAADKVSHAYLFTGPRGTGKTTTARLLAKALLCEKGPTAEPDGTCEQCHAIAEGTHPDVYELDAASRTGVENVREEIIGRVSYAPTRGRYKVYIIDEVHMLSTAAFNALLKTLEEPPEHVVFIMCTTDPHKVLETIQSRCQRFDFRRISNEEIVSRLGAICLEEGIEFEGDALELVASRAEGGMRDALTSLEQLITFGEGSVTLEAAERMLGALDSTDLAEIVRFIGLRDVASCFRWTADYLETGADLAQFTHDLAERVRSMYVLALSEGHSELAADLGETARREMAEELPLFGPDRLARMLGVLGDLTAELRVTTNPRLSFEIALTRMVRPQSDLTLEALAERIEELEARLTAGASLPASAVGGAAGFGGAEAVGLGAAQAAPAAQVASAAAMPATASAQAGVGGSAVAGGGAPGAQAAGAGAGDAPLAGAAQAGPAAERATEAVQSQGGAAVGGEPATSAVGAEGGAALPAAEAAAATMPAEAAAMAAPVEPVNAAVGAAATAPAEQAMPQLAAATVADLSPQATASEPAAAPATAVEATEAAAPAVAAGPLPDKLAADLQNPAALQRVWQQVMTALKQKAAAHGVLFLGTKALFDVASGTLEIAFPAENEFAFATANKPNVQEELREAVQQVCGMALPFVLTRGGAEGGASAAQPAMTQAKPQPAAPQAQAQPAAQAQAASQPQPAATQAQAQAQPAVQAAVQAGEPTPSQGAPSQAQPAAQAQTAGLAAQAQAQPAAQVQPQQATTQLQPAAQPQPQPAIQPQAQAAPDPDPVPYDEVPLDAYDDIAPWDDAPFDPGPAPVPAAAVSAQLAASASAAPAAAQSEPAAAQPAPAPAAAQAAPATDPAAAAQAPGASVPTEGNDIDAALTAAFGEGAFFTEVTD